MREYFFLDNFKQHTKNWLNRIFEFEAICYTIAVAPFLIMARRRKI